MLFGRRWMGVPAKGACAGVWLACGLSCVGGAPTPAKNSRGWAPDGARLVFFVPWDGEASARDVFVVNRDGSGLVNLTCNDVEDANPAWSPDGQWIAYFTRVGEWLQIALVRPDGTGYRQLTTGPTHNHSPEWSPDGSVVLFESNRNGPWDLYHRPVAGGAPVRVTDTPDRDGRPSWAADPERIVYYSDVDGNDELYVLEGDGPPARLTDHPASDFNPTWDPGRGVVFVSNRDGDDEIFRLTSGGDVEQLTTNASGDWNPYPSPDGTVISFYSDRDGGEGLYLMRPDGSDVQMIVSAAAIAAARRGCERGS